MSPGQPYIDPDYVDVAERIRLFYAQYPDGRLVTVRHGLAQPNGKEFVFVEAQAYRTPDDPQPCSGTAWEPIPGPTPFTRDSELMNAETAAWGRAIVAVGIPSKKVASADEMQGRKAAAPRPTSPPRRAGRGTPWKDKTQAQRDLLDACKEAKIDAKLRHRICMMLTGHESSDEMSDEECEKVTGQVAWFQMNRSAGLEALADWEARNLQ